MEHHARAGVAEAVHSVASRGRPGVVPVGISAFVHTTVSAHTTSRR